VANFIKEEREAADEIKLGRKSLKLRCSFSLLSCHFADSAKYKSISPCENYTSDLSSFDRFLYRWSKLKKSCLLAGPFVASGPQNTVYGR
jgi:hypothetical protein